MEHSFGGPSFPEYLERVPPESSGLGCAMGGGVMGELGVSFAAAEALAQVCMEELLSPPFTKASKWRDYP